MSCFIQPKDIKLKITHKERKVENPHKREARSPSGTQFFALNINNVYVILHKKIYCQTILFNTPTLISVISPMAYFWGPAPPVEKH